MAWWWEVAERDHEIQSPISTEKVLQLGDYLRLAPDSRVLDVACGKGVPAALLAGVFGCHVFGIELRPGFAEEARRRAAAEGLESLIEVQTADAATVPLDREAWDAALCLGAAFIWGTIGDAARALRPSLRPHGFVAVGEPYWRRWPLPEGVADEGYVGLQATAARLEQAGFALTGVVAASQDDWDTYESLHWRAVEEWLDEHPGDEDAARLRARHEQARGEYLRFRRALQGWAVFVGRKT